MQQTPSGEPEADRDIDRPLVVQVAVDKFDRVIVLYDDGEVWAKDPGGTWRKVGLPR